MSGVIRDVLHRLSTVIGSALIGFAQEGAGALIRSVQDRLRDSINGKDFMEGNGVDDDYPGFVKACQRAIERKLPLDIRGMKIYLGSQSAPIPSAGLFLWGSGVFAPPVNWDYMRGTNDQFSVIQDAIIAGVGSAILSRYDGAVFTGNELAGSGFIVVGDPSKPNSSAYDTGVPTGYPQVSNPFTKLTNFRAFYFGSHGLRCQGGLEVDTLRKIGALYCNGYGLYVHRTPGIDSPIEYLMLDDCQFEYGLLGNVRLEGVRKSVRITNTTLNDPGQIARRVQQEGLVIESEADIVYPVQIVKDPDSIIAQMISVDDCRAEETQGIVSFEGGIFTGVEVKRNFFIPMNGAWPFYHAAFKSQVFNLRTEENRAPPGTRFYFTPEMHLGSEGISIGEQATVQTALQIDGQQLAQSQVIPQPARAFTSGTIGNGSAGTFTFDLAGVMPISAVGFDQASNFAVFLVTANFQATANDNLGAYLVIVSRPSSGNYKAIVMSTGTPTGFTLPPTVSTAGVISLRMEEFYRGRVIRLDSTALS